MKTREEIGIGLLAVTLAIAMAILLISIVMGIIESASLALNGEPIMWGFTALFVMLGLGGLGVFLISTPPRIAPLPPRPKR
jgi:hypothetical protein